jgi:hypothetical protein
MRMNLTGRHAMDDTFVLPWRLLGVLAGVVGLVGACHPAVGAVTPRANSMDLSGRYGRSDQLLTVRYPVGVLVSAVTEERIVLYLRDGAQASFVIDRHPVSEDLDEIARQLPPSRHAGDVVRDRVVQKTSCFGGLPGVEINELIVANAETAEEFFWQCSFVKDHNLFTFSYAVSTTRRRELSPLLKRIVAATEVR